ncbi:ATP-binding cassette domain-containing protein [uncultured Propionibacterium sp.]|uniref:ABC transporter ATP-binding protein n=1 Tax=uncultured Propionibacterium sp. TaxID=218066 RepID=UPI00292FDD47|nr:ATP-binding cassette domain-containing protein [uncultured Propionibacterium sp.]
MIDAHDLVKEYSGRRVVDGVGFMAPNGCVTGLVGPNGAGKTTTLRMLVGLTRPTSGEALVSGRRYRDLGPYPLRQVGTLLDGIVPDGERRAVDQLRWVARSNRIPSTRIGEVLDLVGLSGDARRRVKGYSLGMKQRLGMATALLGDPQTLILDEPFNGLDPDGIRWLRALVRGHADRGGVVLVSSHLMRELESMTDRVVILSRGRVIADGALDRVSAGCASLEEAYFRLLNKTEGI